MVSSDSGLHPSDVDAHGLGSSPVEMSSPSLTLGFDLGSSEAGNPPGPAYARSSEPLSILGSGSRVDVLVAEEQSSPAWPQMEDESVSDVVKSSTGADATEAIDARMTTTQNVIKCMMNAA